MSVGDGIMGTVFEANAPSSSVGVVVALHANAADNSSTLAHLRELIADFTHVQATVVASDVSHTHTTTWVRIEVCSLAEAATDIPASTYDGLCLLVRIVNEMSYASPTLTDPAALDALSLSLTPVLDAVSP